VFHIFRPDSASGIGHLQEDMLSGLQSWIDLSGSLVEEHVLETDLENASSVLHGMHRIGTEVDEELVYLRGIP